MKRMPLCGEWTYLILKLHVRIIRYTLIPLKIENYVLSISSAVAKLGFNLKREPKYSTGKTHLQGYIEEE